MHAQHRHYRIRRNSMYRLLPSQIGFFSVAAAGKLALFPVAVYRGGAFARPHHATFAAGETDIYPKSSAIFARERGVCGAGPGYKTEYSQCTADFCAQRTPCAATNAAAGSDHKQLPASADHKSARTLCVAFNIADPPGYINDSWHDSLQKLDTELCADCIV